MFIQEITIDLMYLVLSGMCTVYTIIYKSCVCTVCISIHRVMMSGLCFLLVKQYLYEKAPKHFKRRLQQNYKERL